MKKFYYVLTILLAILNVNLTLKPSDICILADPSCDLVTDPECQPISDCSNRKDYPYACSLKGCARDKTACDDFINLGFSVRVKTFQTFNKQLKAYQQFFQRIKNCSLMVHEWNPSNVCLSGTECYYRKRLPLNSGDSFYIKPTVCPCKGKFGFTCGSDYCSVHKESCNDFLVRNIEKENSTFYGIKKCDNDRVILKTNVFNFKLRY